MKTIYKFPIPLGEPFEIELPLYSFVVFVTQQYQKNYIWFEIDLREDRIKRKFKVFGTGQDIPKDYIHLYSWQQIIDGISFIWHLWQLELKY